MANYSVIRTGDSKTDRNFDLIAAALNPALATLAQLSQGCFAYAYTGLAQTLTSGTPAAISFVNVVTDTDGAMGTSTSDAAISFTCPATKPGVYVITSACSVAGCTTIAFTSIYVNGTEALRGNRMPGDAGGDDLGLVIAAPLSLMAGDRVTIRVLSSTTCALETSASTPKNWVTIFKIPSAS